MRLLFTKSKRSCFTMLLLLFALPLAIMAQTKSVSGVVKDNKGEPVPNVSVTVKGTKTAVATDANGSFTINAAPGATLLFTAVSFEPAETKVGAANSYAIVMPEKQTVLTDVVGRLW